MVVRVGSWGDSIVAVSPAGGRRRRRAGGVKGFEQLKGVHSPCKAQFGASSAESDGMVLYSGFMQGKNAVTFRRERERERRGRMNKQTKNERERIYIYTRHSKAYPSILSHSSYTLHCTKEEKVYIYIYGVHALK